MKGAEITHSREQLVLIPTSLEDAIGAGHQVRLIDSPLEVRAEGRLG